MFDIDLMIDLMVGRLIFFYLFTFSSSLGKETTSELDWIFANLTQQQRNGTLPKRKEPFWVKEFWV